MFKCAAPLKRAFRVSYASILGESNSCTTQILAWADWHFPVHTHYAMKYLGTSINDLNNHLCISWCVCIYTNHWLQFGLACQTRVSLKGSGGSVCVSFLLMTSSHAQPIQIVITNSFLFIHHCWVFFQSLGNSGGVGLGGNWMQVSQLWVIRYQFNGKAEWPSSDDATSK